jgi:cell division protein FtsW
LAYFLESRWQQISDWKHVLLPAAAPSILLALLIVKEPDLGTAVACMAITASMLYIAGMKMRYLLYGLLASLLPLYVLIVRVPWRWHRIVAFLDPWKDPQGHGFHIIQSMIAVSTGGLTGAGLMEGKQKLFYLPEPHTDFIYANIAEELGLWGAVLVVVLFAIFLWRGIRVALKTQDPFARFLATGITAMVVVQALINISVVLGMMPTKGIPLPFISYGGSSLFITLASVGILLNITQQNN